MTPAKTLIVTSFYIYRGLKPIARSFFAVPAQNQSEQFIYFISLVSWLLAINNHQVTGWNKYDDPMTASQNVILELKKLNIELDMPSSKLKSGYGEGVVQVLHILSKITIDGKFRFKKPVIKDEGQGFDDDADEMGEDMEGHADIADMVHNDQSDDEEEMIEDFNDNGAYAKELEQDLQQNQIIQSSISREEWMLEVERVAFKLKINKAGTDGKEWRSHLDQTKKYAENVRGHLPDVRAKLERLADDVSKALERIGRKEGLLSRSF